MKEARQVITSDPCESESGASGSDGKVQCRFCWGTDSSEENPCIVPCNCSGSVGFIHYLCLKNWLQLKMSVKETSELQTLYWKNFECEICKFAYPYLFRVN